MKKEYYDLLGLTEEATDEEIENRYRELKKKYENDRWLEGEAGNEAAKMLNKLDVAYQEIMSDRSEAARSENRHDMFSEVEALLKSGSEEDISKAQEKLDSFSERNAYWHYLQGVLFYKKNWNNECKKQIEIAMQLDPENQKYKDAYSKLCAQGENKKNAKNDKNQDGARESEGQNASYSYDGDPYDGDQMGGSACSEFFNWCATMCCINAMCNLCCNCR